MSLKKRFGGLVAAHRRRRGLTQQQLADATSMSPDMISKIETGNTAVRFSTAEKLADALGVDAGELFGVSLDLAHNRSGFVGLVADLAKLSDEEVETARAILEAAFRIDGRRTRVPKR